MAHEHRWIDITTVSDSGERRMCAICNREEVRPADSEKWKQTAGGKVARIVRGESDGLSEDRNRATVTIKL